MATQVRGLRRDRGRARRAATRPRPSPRSWATRLVVVFAHQVSRLGGEVHDYEEALRERGRAVLEEARRIAREAGVEIEIVMRESSPAEALIEVADEHDARDDRRRLLRRAPAQERARGVDADAAAAPRPSGRCSSFAHRE